MPSTSASPLSRTSSGMWPSPTSKRRSAEHTSELQSPCNLVCRLLLEKKKKKQRSTRRTTVVGGHGDLSGARTRSCVCFATVYLSVSVAQFCFVSCFFFFFFFNDTATTEIYTLSLHDALPICRCRHAAAPLAWRGRRTPRDARRSEEHTSELQSPCNLVCRLLLEKKKKTD